ncbi:MAG: hypothetical protein IPN05_19405 [Sulfuritalea sp.]|nr:hypothetical protein [Sulfuritalea sp.]
MGKAERKKLTSLQRKRTAAIAQERRTRLILLLNDGVSRDAIRRRGCDSRSSRHGKRAEARSGWRERAVGTRGVRRATTRNARKRGCPTTRSSANQRIARRTGAAANLATKLMISFMGMQLVWIHHALKLHGLDRHMASSDPQFVLH